MSSSIIKIIIAGDARAAIAAMEATEAKADSSFGKVGALAAGLTAATAAAAIGAGVALFKIGDSFDEAYNKIKGKTAATGEELEGLKADFRSILTEVPTDMGKASDAISTVFQKLGDQGPITKGIAEQLLEVSRITKTDLAGNLDVATSALKNWNIPAEQQSRVLDEMYRASTQTGASFQSIAQGTVESGAQLRALGFEMTDAIAITAQLGAAGLSTSDVMPALSKAMAHAAKEGKDAGTLFQETFDKIKNTPDATVAAGEALQVFGAKAGPKFAELIREGKFDYVELMKTIQKGDTTILGAGKSTMDFGDKWDLIKNRVLVALEPVAMRVFDSVGKAMDYISAELIPQAQAAWEEWGPTVIATVKNLADGVETAFSRVREAVQVASQFVQRALTWLSTEYAKHKAQFDKVFADIAKIWRSLEGIVKPATDAVVAIITWVVNVVQQLWDAFGEHLLSHLMVAWDAMVQVIQGAANIIKGLFDIIAAIFTGDWGRLWDGVKEVLGGVWDVIVGTVRSSVNAISLIIGAAMAAISVVWSGVWNGLQTIVGTAWDGVYNAVTGAWDRLYSWFTGLPGAIAGVASGMWDGILSAFKGTINGVISAWNHLGIPSFHVHITMPSEIPNIDFDTPSIDFPDIPYLAEGSIIRRPTLAMIGESGDELVLPLTKPGRMRQLLDEAGVDRSIGQSAPAPVHVTQHITAYDPRVAAQQSADEWYWAQKTRGL